MNRLRAKLVRDDGGVLVLVAVALPVLISFFMFVAEISNMYVHKRHLQAQVDAAALAGGNLFAACFGGGAGNSAIFNEASKYAGAAGQWGGTTYGSALHNVQVGGVNRGSVTVLYQSKTYASGGPAPDDTSTNGPCDPSSLMFDVKATEAGLPLFFANFIPGLKSTTINAHARVQLAGITSAKPGLPLAVPDINPSRLAVTFVDEATGTELTGCSGSALLSGTTCTFSLTKTGPSGGLTLWAGSGTVIIPTAPKTIGVRVGLGGSARTCANTAGGSGFSCYDAGQLSQGLVAIRDYAVGAANSAVQPSLPQLQAVWPSSETACGTTPFVSDASGKTTCGINVAASVDFGTGNVDPTLAKSSGGVKAKVSATLNGTTVQLTRVASSYNATNHSWRWSTSGFPLSVPVDASGTPAAYPITVGWEEQDGTTSLGTCSTAGGNKCKGTFSTTAQRVTSARDDNDGPVKLVQLTEPSSTDAPYSLQAGTHTLNFTVGVQGNLQIHTPCSGSGSGATYTCATDPATLLRFASASGSQNYAINCGPGNFRSQIGTGCTNRYSINAADVCPDPANPSPPDCAAIFTGDKTGQIRQGMNDHFAPGGTCTPNNYPNFTPGDPRVVILIVTDFSAFSGSGSASVPVVTFAAFYVTGWDGAPGSCQNEPYPFPGASTKADAWGHFIKYVDTADPGGGPLCDPNGLAPCVPSMTR